MSAYEHCKPGCVQPGMDKGCAHRTPIDCVTTDDLWQQIKDQKETIAALQKEMVYLKAALYDAEHDYYED